METIQQILYGFSVVFQPMNLMCAFLGALVGTLVGVLPGLGPVGAMSILLPVTYGMSPTGGDDHAGWNLLWSASTEVPPLRSW